MISNCTPCTTVGCTPLPLCGMGSEKLLVTSPEESTLVPRRRDACNEGGHCATLHSGRCHCQSLAIFSFSTLNAEARSASSQPLVGDTQVFAPSSSHGPPHGRVSIIIRYHGRCSRCRHRQDTSQSSKQPRGVSPHDGRLCHRCLRIAMGCQLEPGEIDVRTQQPIADDVN